MEKMTWTRPVAAVEQFMPNEYIAACWWVNCNISRGNVYLDNNGVEGLQSTGLNADERIGRNVTGCNTKHVGVTEEPVENSYWVATDFWGSESGEPVPCFSWKDRRGWHSVYIGDQNYDTNPNAS